MTAPLAARASRLLVLLTALLAMPVVLLLPLDEAGASTSESAARARLVVVVGVEGLAWRDVDPARTPALTALTKLGDVASLSVRAAASVTTRADGWVVLGTGNRARAPRDAPPLRTGVDVSALVRATAEDNAGLDYDAQPGALGASLNDLGLSAVAAGPGPVLALSTPADVVPESGAPTGCGPAGTGASLPGAGLLLVEPAGGLAGSDLCVAALMAQLDPALDLLLVVGVADAPDGVPGLRAVMARGPGFGGGGRLRSASTRRSGFVQLVDVAPTVLGALGVEVPPSMTGQRMTRVAGGRAANVRAQLVDHARAADAHRRYVPPFFTLLVLAQLVLYGWAWWALRRSPPALAAAKVRRITKHAALAFAGVPAATYLAQLLPWWRHGLVVLIGVVAGFAALVWLAAISGPWRRSLLGPAGVVAGITAIVLVADLTTGARLQLSSLAGYSPVVAGRFAGVGNVAFAVLATSALLASAAVAAALPDRRRLAIAAVVLIGAVTVAVDGNPRWGSDFGGVLALVPAFVVLGMLLAGRRVTWRTVLLAGLAAVVVVGGFATLDALRPPEQRTHLGRFARTLADGGAATVLERKAKANLRLLTHSVLTFVVPIATAFLGLVLLRPWGGLRRALERSPELRAGLVSVLVLSVVGFATNDSGVAVPALALTLALPLALAVSLRSAELDAATVGSAHQVSGSTSLD